MVSVTRSMVPCSSVRQIFLVPGPVSVSTSEISKFKHKSQSLGNQRLEIFSTSLKLLYAKNTKMQMAVYNSVGTGSAHPSAPSSPCRKGWILGVLLSVILPFCRNKWGGLLMMKDKIEAVVELADQVADIVEEVAEGVEKVADEVADHLPEGGKLKQVATFVENVARETAKDADLIDDVIEKVKMQMEEVEKEVEKELVSLSEQATEQASGISEESKG
ncbi:PHAGE CAPSID SCAFFOLDING PROTEIN (GPO) SERINE PEPTIDASE [Salix viminalis]|uniref:PHAGE CAPSID SCAFFOLDING PROTEIN (GPO) SERINE PEPTIDASE n=1 Tax=Salix viminalis TaxID=40686 RepID=A0A9Q0UHX4_SALVM|nr:PHAGE CAPSID SCAFFOLDING PROTEIN (GPO) SERINE PEPTIDASE [Salix viminalis]